MSRTISLFWSYAHADNDGDRDRITQLAADIRSEIALVTGSDVELFVDREEISWGENWRSRIANALTASTFLIPILTPRYFQREECRREFREFYGQASGLGKTKLIMPLVYLPVSDLREGASDELMAIAATIQYVDWSRLRLEEVSSAPYRTAVNSVAARIVELADEMDALTESDQFSNAGLPAEQWGLQEAMQEVARRLPEWRTLVEDDPVSTAQIEAIDDVYTKRFHRAPQSQRVAIMHKLAQDTLPIQSRAAKAAQRYSALSLEMNPYVLAALRIVRMAPGGRSALDDLFAAVQQAKVAIDRKPTEGRATASTLWRHWANLGGLFAKMADSFLEDERYRDEGNSLVNHWWESLTEIYGAPSMENHANNGGMVDIQHGDSHS